MKGVQFFFDDEGGRRAVLIDLVLHGELWEDFFDAALAQDRRDEPRESLKEVHRKVLGQRNLPYEIAFVRSARRELERLPLEIATRAPRIERLAADRRPPDSHKLRGQQGLWRVRVGDYRVVYDISNPDQRIEVIVVRHRSAAYR